MWSNCNLSQQATKFSNRQWTETLKMMTGVYRLVLLLKSTIYHYAWSSHRATQTEPSGPPRSDSCSALTRLQSHPERCAEDTVTPGCIWSLQCTVRTWKETRLLPVGLQSYLPAVQAHSATAAESRLCPVLLLCYLGVKITVMQTEEVCTIVHAARCVFIQRSFNMLHVHITMCIRHNSPQVEGTGLKYD